MVWINDSQIKPAHECSPTDMLGIQEVANVLSTHLDSDAMRTDIAGRIEISDQRTAHGLDYFRRASAGCGRIGVTHTRFRAPAVEAYASKRAISEMMGARATASNGSSTESTASENGYDG